VYIGHGDQHDTSYHKLGISSTFREMSSFSDPNTAFLGKPIDHVYCPFTITVYPSDVMKGSFTTKTPILLALAIMCVFAFTCIVFLWYDYGVERRQKVVHESPVTTSSLVSSMFPSNVRDQVLQDTKEKHGRVSRKPINNVNSSRTERQPIRVGLDNDIERPLAKLYPDTCVFFGDLVGFTKWSSSREPCQVFTLLETIYRAFDQIAKKRKVFKIETIGDCYVAVTGLPEPDPNHSVTMVRFASECIYKMKRITNFLGVKLGPDTTELCLRIGLNSGPTTAGVLRGERARFQLFGDTVNTGKLMKNMSISSFAFLSSLEKQLKGLTFFDIPS
jgi:class 3 adenylate cyclase